MFCLLLLFTTVNTSSLLTVKPGEGSTERQKLVSQVNQPLLVLPSQRANGLSASSAPTTQLNVQGIYVANSSSIKLKLRKWAKGFCLCAKTKWLNFASPSAVFAVSSNAASSSALNICPRCGAHFKMIEALRGHMCVSAFLNIKVQAPQRSYATTITINNNRKNASK